MGRLGLRLRRAWPLSVCRSEGREGEEGRCHSAETSRGRRVRMRMVNIFEGDS